MVSNLFTILFLSTSALTLGLFALAEAMPAHRNRLAAYAAVAEAAVFALMAWLFWHVSWGSWVPAAVMALLPIGGVIFSLNMAHKRLTRRIL